MRISLRRKLDALGYQIGEKLPPSGIQAHCCSFSGQDMIIFEKSAFGLSSMQIYIGLREYGFGPSFLVVGDCWLVLVQDSTSVRNFLSGIRSKLLASRNSMVHIPGIGFESLDQSKHEKGSRFIGPLISIVATSAIALWLNSDSIASDQDIPEQEEGEVVQCSIDFGEKKYEQWIVRQLRPQADKLLSSAVFLETPKGSMSASVLDQIGSTLLIRIEVGCDDGRTKSQLFRSDAVLSSSLVELSSD